MCLTVIQQLQPKEPRMQEISHKRAWSNTSHSKKSSSRFIWRARHGWRREHAHRRWQEFAASSKTSSARRGQAGHLWPRSSPLAKAKATGTWRRGPAQRNRRDSSAPEAASVPSGRHMETHQIWERKAQPQTCFWKWKPKALLSAKIRVLLK